MSDLTSQMLDIYQESKLSGRREWRVSSDVLDALQRERIEAIDQEIAETLRRRSEWVWRTGLGTDTFDDSIKIYRAEADYLRSTLPAPGWRLFGLQGYVDASLPEGTAKIVSVDEAIGPRGRSRS